MESANANFAGDLVKRFGQDRFYHALLRIGSPHEAAIIHRVLGGDATSWGRLRAELRLKHSVPWGVQSLDEDEVYSVLCRVVHTLSYFHKEYAIRSPQMPPHIHARILLGPRNEWASKYIKNLEEEPPRIGPERRLEDDI